MSRCQYCGSYKTILEPCLFAPGFVSKKVKANGYSFNICPISKVRKDIKALMKLTGKSGAHCETCEGSITGELS